MKDLKHIEEVLFDSITSLEAYRQEVLPKDLWLNQFKKLPLMVFLIGLFSILLGIAVFLFFPNEKSLYFIYPLIIGFFLISCSVFFQEYYIKKLSAIEEVHQIYRNKYKQNIIQPISKILLPNFDYFSEKGFRRKELENMGLFNLKLMQVQSQNWFKSKIENKFTIEFGEILLKRYQLSAVQFLPKRLFRGLVFKVEIGSNFQPFSIYSKTLENIIKKDDGLYLYKISIPKPYLIYLKNNLLLEHWPHDFFKFLRKINVELKTTFILKQKKNFLYLALYPKHNFFNPNLKDPLFNTNSFLKNKNEQILDSNLAFTKIAHSAVGKFHNELKLCLEIIEELKKLIPNLPRL